METKQLRLGGFPERGPAAAPKPARKPKEVSVPPPPPPLVRVEEPTSQK